MRREKCGINTAHDAAVEASGFRVNFTGAGLFSPPSFPVLLTPAALGAGGRDTVPPVAAERRVAIAARSRGGGGST